MLWGVITKPSQWPSGGLPMWTVDLPMTVNAYKKAIADAHRPIVWKTLMCMEVENLAIKQHLTGTRVQNRF